MCAKFDILNLDGFLVSGDLEAKNHSKKPPQKQAFLVIFCDY
ncbi:hypothetical protein SPONN_1591 [uncultured Candidatus Thioglobus sp.]|nr:hypothetical protein SPONN_1591 [uncultured Candidatus Thioglobus sp.]